MIRNASKAEEALPEHIPVEVQGVEADVLIKAFRSHQISGLPGRIMKGQHFEPPLFPNRQRATDEGSVRAGHLTRSRLENGEEITPLI